MTDHEAYVAFNMVPDIGAVKVAALARKQGGVAAAWEALVAAAWADSVYSDFNI